MTKSTITKTWLAGLIVVIAGLIVGGVSLGLMLAYGGTFQPAPSGNGSDYVPSLNATFWTTLTFMILGFTVAAAGGVVQLVAWVGWGHSSTPISPWTRPGSSSCWRAG